MGITVKEITDELRSLGIRTSEDTLKYYLGLGLLPKPDKEGGFREGVRLVFPDREEALSFARRIYELKGLGYKLSEIKEEFRKERRAKIYERRKKSLDNFVEFEGYVYLNIPSGSSEGIFASNLGNTVTQEFYTNFREWGRFDDLVKSMNMIEEKGFCLAEKIYDSKRFYDDFILNECASGWMLLRYEWGIDWDMMQSLSQKHCENIDHFFFWPDPDGKVFSDMSIRFMKQQALTEFGWMLNKYFEKVHNGDGALQEDHSHDIRFVRWSWDYLYENTSDMIEDFLTGKCAFVPRYGGEIFDDTPKNDVFLKRF